MAQLTPLEKRLNSSRSAVVGAAPGWASARAYPPIHRPRSLFGLGLGLGLGFGFDLGLGLGLGLGLVGWILCEL